MKKEILLPPLVLALICAVCCALLAFANALTADRIAAAEMDSIQESLQALPNAGTFEEIADFEAVNPDRAAATALYKDENGTAAVLITADGYNKGGLQVIIGVNDGTVTGIAFVSNTETPGLGTKVESNPELLADNLVGLSDESQIEAVDGISGATRSSNALKAAALCALDTVQANSAVLEG